LFWGWSGGGGVELGDVFSLCFFFFFGFFFFWNIATRDRVLILLFCFVFSVHLTCMDNQ